jgi:hypothetical protein
MAYAVEEGDVGEWQVPSQGGGELVSPGRAVRAEQQEDRLADALGDDDEVDVGKGVSLAAHGGGNDLCCVMGHGGVS